MLGQCGRANGCEDSRASARAIGHVARSSDSRNARTDFVLDRKHSISRVPAAKSFTNSIRRRAVKYGLDNPLGRREFKCDDGTRIVVTLGAPYRHQEYDEIWCGYMIGGAEPVIVGRVVGVDEFQSILLAMKTVSAHLLAISEKRSARVFWDGARAGNPFGLPLPDIA